MRRLRDAFWSARFTDLGTGLALPVTSLVIIGLGLIVGNTVFQIGAIAFVIGASVLRGAYRMVPRTDAAAGRVPINALTVWCIAVALMAAGVLTIVIGAFVS
jgi:hypothetical protein